MIIPVLDPHFRPFIAFLEQFERDVAALPEERRNRIALSVSHGGRREVYAYPAFCDGEDDARNCFLAERLAKTLLWTYGGHRLGVYGSRAVYQYLKERYCAEGARAFDADFMQTIYEQPFAVEELKEEPKRSAVSLRVGGCLKGCRIGFDAGGSDRKVSAVIDGKAVYSEEVVWHPKTAEDPRYHYQEILSALKTAASKMPRVDAIGVSSAGVYVDNKIMAASLFLKVDREKYGDYVKNMYLNAAKELGAPVTVANDGDVTALAGSMELGEGRVLGIAMGTIEAAGYINAEGGLNGWLSELAFVPVDLDPEAMRDEWSGDTGVGCKYFSQDAVIKLAEAGGLRFGEGLSPAEKLKTVQSLAEGGDPLAERVFEDIGVYLGYTLPFYARFYDMKHVLLLGRVTSGRGGTLLLESCKRVLKEEFPAFDAPHLSLPDEKSRRVGQSIAAASLPEDR